MGLLIVQVDAFTERPFAGNPAAVCILPHPRDDRWLQGVAREMNLSETAFLLQREEGCYDLRWFTPTTEVDLCGHATLASAHVLWEDGHMRQEAHVRFYTRSGVMSAWREGDWIELDFPAEIEEPVPTPHAIIEALGVTPEYVGKNRLDYLVEVDSEETVRRLRPDFAALAGLVNRGVIVTARAEEADAYDFVSRYFAPAIGIDEDPVTGSAHCCLGPFWSERLGRSELVGYQASARGGCVRVRSRGARVVLGGKAVTVLRGELLVE